MVRSRHGPAERAVVRGPTCPRHAPRPRPLLVSTSTARQTHPRRIQTPAPALLSRLYQSAHFTPADHTKAQIPIAQPIGPAGSCMGGFRTQAPENLHLLGRLVADFRSLGAEGPLCRPVCARWTEPRTYGLGADRPPSCKPSSLQCAQGASLSQISVPSARVRASSTSTPRYLTVLSIFVCPSRIWTARRFPVAL